MNILTRDVHQNNVFLITIWLRHVVTQIQAPCLYSVLIHLSIRLVGLC